MWKRFLDSQLQMALYEALTLKAKRSLLVVSVDEIIMRFPDFIHQRFSLSDEMRKKIVKSQIE